MLSGAANFPVTGRGMSKATRLFLLLGALSVTVPSSNVFAAEPEPAVVLMLGDSGFHKPPEFYRHLVRPLAESGIELRYADKLADLNPASLEEIDGLLIFANIEQITPDAESTILDFVDQGGGLIPVHCASFCFLNSDKYVELVGGQFKRHGFTRFETTIVAPSHEIMQGLDPIRSMDESYMHARLNPDMVVLETRGSDSGPVSDPNGEPYTWVRESGQGRVFYTAWGHDHRTWGNPGFQQLLARGILWACGHTLSAAIADDQGVDPKSAAVVLANRPFEAPRTTAPSIDEDAFSATDVGEKIPNYTPGARWGTQGTPLALMQDPLPAEQSVRAYATPDGFQLAIWAKETDGNWPDGSQEPSDAAGLQGKPIAMNWDEDGRLWVCETVDYPNKLATSRGAGRDHIKICEDTDNDGQADSFTVFAKDLSIPSTLVCYRGGVIVQDGASTVYLKDLDGDGRADFRQTLITGWAMGDTHGGVSNFQYGPDNWIWGMQGYNNSQPVINGEEQQRFRQGFWRFKVRPGASDDTAPVYRIASSSGQTSGSPTSEFDQHAIRVEALEFIRGTNNNTWGLGFSEEGYVFGSTANGCPSVYMPIPNRNYDQVAGWSPEILEMISDNDRFHPIDAKIRQVDYHGGFTAGCGSALYTARNYPETWWNRIQLVCGPTGHLVGAFLLEKEGAAYRSRNSFNAAASIDDWSAPIMAEVGPDGNVWVLDWYNYIVQHNPTPNGFETGRGAAYESDLRDKRFARIYRLLHQSKPGANASSHSMRLGDATNAELVAALSSDNFFWRRTAQRLLVERAATGVETLDALVELVVQEHLDAIGLDAAAMHAIWTLSGLAETGSEDAALKLAKACEAGFQHSSSPVRRAAVQYCAVDQIPLATEAGLGVDADPQVRLAMLLRVADAGNNVALSAEDLAVQLSAITGDTILLDAWTSAASTNPVDSVVAVSKLNLAPKDLAAVCQRVAVLGEHIARSEPGASQIERLLEIDPQSAVATSLWQGLANGWPRNWTVAIGAESQRRLRNDFLADEASAESKAAILAVAGKWSITGLADVVARIQDELLGKALDSNVDSDERLSAWDQAIQMAPGRTQLLNAAQQLLTPQLPPELGVEVLRSLQAVRIEGVSQLLLDQRDFLGPKLRSQILTSLLARADSTTELLDAIASGDVQFSELRLDQRQAILSHPDASIATRAEQLMESQGALVASDRQSLVEEWMPVAEMPGDAANGEALFKKHCSVCHIHGEMGTAIGPNLTGMAVHPKAEILVNVLDPSRSVENNFRTYQILTLDGLVLSGMLAGESANSLRVIDSQGKEQYVLREDIERMIFSKKSLMPEGFESSITKEEMADLLAFLAKQERYTPLTTAKAATLSGSEGLPGFGGRSGDKIELENYGRVEFEGIPFELISPEDGRIANIIAVQRPFRRGNSTLPESVSIACSGRATAIHLLGGVAGRIFPNQQEASTSLIVRCVYADETTQDFELSAGEHIASYVAGEEVPKSRLAIESGDRQVRYLKFPLDGEKELQRIDLVKGNDFSIPLVFAVTIEAAEGEAH